MLFHGEALKPWQIWTRRPLWLKTLIGMLIGVGLGVGFEEQALLLKPLGVLFVNTIQMLMVPLIFCSVIAGLTSLLKGKGLDRIGSKAICLYFCSTAIAICIGLMMGWLLEPGMGANMGPHQRLGGEAQPALASVLNQLVPSNPVQAMVDGKILQVIVFAVALAVALNASGRRGRPAILFFTSLAEGMFKLTQMVMALAPYGVCALMAWMTCKYGLDLLLPLLKVIGAVYLGCLLHVLGVYSSLLLLLARLNPLHYFKSIVDAQAVAFTSSSSSSTLPISLACAEKRLGGLTRHHRQSAAHRRHHQHGWHGPLSGSHCTVRGSGIRGGSAHGRLPDHHQHRHPGQYRHRRHARHRVNAVDPDTDGCRTAAGRGCTNCWY